MARFITFFSYTGESAKAMIEHPSDRSAAVKALVESLGGTHEAFYWMQGSHDGFIIACLPDGVDPRPSRWRSVRPAPSATWRPTRSTTTTSRRPSSLAP